MSLLLSLNIFWQGGLIHLCLIFERIDMDWFIFFKNLLLQFLSKIDQGDWWDYACINYVFSYSFHLQSTIFLFYKVGWLRLMVTWTNQFLVVWFDNTFHILCETVAYLQIISMENIMELVQKWKMQIYQFKELLYNVCNDCVNIRLVTPYGVTVASSFYMTCAPIAAMTN